MMRTGFQKETVAGPKDGGKSSVNSKQTSLLGTAGEDEAPGPRAEASWLLRDELAAQRLAGGALGVNCIHKVLKTVEPALPA